MDAKRFARVREIFESAVEQPAATRARFLARECGGDKSLRREVERLLARDETPASLGAQLDAGATPAGPDAGELGGTLLGARIGGCRLLRVLASGGMGTVYEAEQDEPRRKVALKVLRLGLRSPAALARFRREAEVLARLQHPAIAQIYAAGVQREGELEVPWFAMELVPGARDLLTWSAARPRREKLALYCELCAAVHHGHSRGIVHRDLKPSNVLVDAEGRVKVIDFGVARALEGPEPADELTRTGEMVGTLQYMSPEQLAGGREPVDARADVYALGAVLYELLAGEPPHDLAGRPLSEVARVVRETPPRRLSEIDANLRGDLEWIALKAVAREPERRYASAAELAADLERHLRGEPVLASPPSAVYRARKYVARHRVGVIAAATVALALLAGTGLALAGLFKAQRNETLAKERLADVQKEADKVAVINDFLVELLRSPNPVHAGPDVRVVEVLERAAAGLQARFAERPELRAPLQAALGESYFALSEYGKAEEFLPAALATLRAEGLLESRDGLRALIGMARLRAELGAMAESASLADEALALALRLDAGGPPEREHEALSARASLLFNAHVLAAAERDARDALALAERLPEYSSHELPHVLSRALLAQGRPEEARPWLDKAQELAARTYSEEHFATAELRRTRAALLQEIGRPEEALPLCRSALATMERELGPKHARSLAVREETASILRSLGRLEEALPLFERACELRREMQGPDAPDLGATLRELGLVLMDLGRVQEAEERLREARELALRVLGEKDDLTLGASANLAELLRRTQRLDEAEPLGLEAALGLRATHGDAHSLAIGACTTMAGIAQARGRVDEAVDWLRRALDGQRALAPGSHPDTATLLCNLGFLLAAQRRFAEAEPLMREALDMQREVLPEESFPVALTRLNLGDLLVRMTGRAGEAEALLSTAHASLQQQFGDGDPRTKSAQRALDKARQQLAESKPSEQGDG